MTAALKKKRKRNSLEAKKMDQAFIVVKCTENLHENVQQFRVYV